LTATSDTIGEGQPAGRPNQGKSARSRQGQSTTRANNATPTQLLTENQGARDEVQNRLGTYVALMY
jgi:hypothetical protein